ncbi:MAG TPA: alpha/beta hydrolase, partial [Candidatus Omnitrophota bacterium]|nr:alpha/beta hydrolase [Candidatus Omnitrophota bacterium]
IRINGKTVLTLKNSEGILRGGSWYDQLAKQAQDPEVLDVLDVAKNLDRQADHLSHFDGQGMSVSAIRGEISSLAGQLNWLKVRLSASDRSDRAVARAQRSVRQQTPRTTTQAVSALQRPSKVGSVIVGIATSTKNPMDTEAWRPFLEGKIKAGDQAAIAEYVALFLSGDANWVEFRRLLEAGAIETGEIWAPVLELVYAKEAELAAQGAVNETEDANAAVLGGSFWVRGAQSLLVAGMLAQGISGFNAGAAEAIADSVKQEMAADARLRDELHRAMAEFDRIEKKYTLKREFKPGLHMIGDFDDIRPTVILIHGGFSRPDAFERFAPYFREKFNIVIFAHDSAERLTRTGELFRADYERLLKGTSSKKIVVTHSFGSTAFMRAMLDASPEFKAELKTAKVFMLSPAFFGSARVGMGGSWFVQGQLWLGSLGGAFDFLEATRRQGQYHDPDGKTTAELYKRYQEFKALFNDEVEVIALTNDSHAPKRQESVLGQRYQQIVVEGGALLPAETDVGHSEILRRRDVVETIINKVSGGASTETNPAIQDHVKARPGLSEERLEMR